MKPRCSQLGDDSTRGSCSVFHAGRLLSRRWLWKRGQLPPSSKMATAGWRGRFLHTQGEAEAPRRRRKQRCLNTPPQRVSCWADTSIPIMEGLNKQPCVTLLFAEQNRAPNPSWPPSNLFHFPNPQTLATVSLWPVHRRKQEAGLFPGKESLPPGAPGVATHISMADSL